MAVQYEVMQRALGQRPFGRRRNENWAGIEIQSGCF
jgi:hypothetical protein